MKDLYMLSARGTTFFLEGLLSLREREVVDSLLYGGKLTTDNCFVGKEENEICERFIELVHNNLGISLRAIPVSYVFRIK